MKLHTTVLAATLALAGVAHAQEATPAPGAVQETEEIVVLSARDVGVRIDRREYTIRDDAEAQSTDMFEVLGRIPSVSVSPEGAISLLGASGVEVQINGQPAPEGSLEQVLRGIPGSQVKRIEIITNPSAQFSSAASGGIINIITKDRFEAGFAGSVRGNLDSMGGGAIGIAPSWSGEKLTLSGWAGFYASGEDRAAYGVRNELPGGPNQSKNGRNGFDYEGWYVGANASYKPTERRRINGALGADQFDYRFHERLNWISDTTPDALRTTANHSINDNSFATLEIQQDGAQPRALTKASMTVRNFRKSFSSEIFELYDGAITPNRYRNAQESDTDAFNLKIDAERPQDGERFLTWGVAVDLGAQTSQNNLAVLQGSGPAPYAATLEGEDRTIAAYATYQFDLGRWTILPGVRAEEYWRSVGNSGVTVEDDDFRAFPSLHVRRKLSDTLNLDVSYTGRISRPNFDQLDPLVRVYGDNASSGNPALQPTTIDAYEANLSYQKGKRTFSATFFDRISHDVVSTRRDLVGGIVYVRPVNAGENEERGIEIQARAPLSARWSYVVSANALERSYDALQGGAFVRRSATQYSGNARLDYRDPDQDAIGADQVQLQVDVQGPSYDLQSKQYALAVGNFTWRRRLTDSLIGVLSVNDVFASRKRTSETSSADFYEKTTRDSPGARIRFTLTYQFGSPPDSAQQDNAPRPPGG